MLIGQDLEFKCGSKRCGAEPGVIVLHRFNPGTGEYLGTKRYRDIESRKD